MTEAANTPAPAPAPAAAPAPAPAPTPSPAPAPAASDALATPAPSADQDWRASLPEDLRNDPTLSKYGSLDDFARGHLETKRAASAKAVPLPGDSEESRRAFADALRPESADAYDFGNIPEGVDNAMVDGFREWAFETGLPPYLAKDALEFYTGAMGKQIEAANAESQQQVEAFKAEYGGGYDEKLGQVRQMIESFSGTPLEIGEDDLNRLDMKIGSDSLLKFMFALHDRVGDLGYAGENDNPPAGFQRIAPENAEATWNAKVKDAEWRKKAKVAGSAEAKESEYLQKMMAQHRVSKQQA